MSVILDGPAVLSERGNFVTRDFRYEGNSGELFVEIKEGPNLLAVTRLAGQTHEQIAEGKEAESLYDMSITDHGAVSMIMRAITEMRSEAAQ